MKPISRTALGKLGEELARRMLQELGNTILDTNYRCRWGEVDIVAQDGDDIVFVEVRTCSSAQFGTPEESITEAKIERLVSTAQEYLQSKHRESTNWRIDLVAVRMRGDGQMLRIDHIKHAVEL